MSAKIVVIGQGEFGNSLSQGLEMASIASTNATVSVEKVSATEFFSMSADEMSQVLKNASYIMYCGRKLSENAGLLAVALQGAREISSVLSDKGPLLELIDWSNPDPHAESFDGAVALAAAVSSVPDQIVWKVTGVSSLDVAVHDGGDTVAKVYSNRSEASPNKPSLDFPGLIWKVADKNTLYAEVSSRLVTRAEVERWYDATYLGLAVFLVAFGYAITRYTEWVHGSYGYTMIPLYLLDKGFSWAALWMISAAPFAGNLLTLSHVFSSWNQANGIDKVMSILCAAIMVVPVFLFVLPWVTWAVLRSLFSSWNTNQKLMSRTKAMLVDMISLKTETGVVGFVFLFTHAFMGSLVVFYKTKWFDADNKGRFYGNNELSLASGVLAFTLVTILSIRSLMGKGSWMKLKPLYVYVAPVAVFLGTFHIIMMGYKGWGSLFDYSSKKGQPSPTFISSMFSLGVIAAHLFLSVVGTKKRSRKGVRVMKHSATENAFAKYNKVTSMHQENTSHIKDSFHEDSSAFDV